MRTRYLFLLLLLIPSFSIGQPLTGANTLWNGNYDADFSEISNWNNGVPDASTFTIATVDYNPNASFPNPEISESLIIGQLRTGKNGTSSDTVTVTLKTGSALTATEIKSGYSLEIHTSNSNGTLVVDGGEHVTTGQVIVSSLQGNNNPNAAFGTMVMNDGSLTIGGGSDSSGGNGLLVGQIQSTNSSGNSTGSFTLNGGSLSVGGNSFVGYHGGNGASGTATGTFTINGGTAYFNNFAPVWTGTAILSLNGGSLVVNTITEKTGDLTINMNGGIFINDRSNINGGIEQTRMGIFQRFVDGTSDQGGSVTVNVTGGYLIGSSTELEVRENFTHDLVVHPYGDYALKIAHDGAGRTAMWSTTVFTTQASASPGGSVSPSGAIVNSEPTEITLTATGENGYVFGIWSGDVPEELERVNPLTVTVEEDGSITALFSQDSSDSDRDGLSQYQEVIVYGTDPEDADSDDDGFDDGFEVETGYNPMSISSTPDAYSEILTAVEFRFNAANGVSYRIESSTDLENWPTVEAEIIGSSARVTRFYSIEGTQKRFYRAKRND